MADQTERAVLAGGCFWGMQDLIRRMPGVLATQVGYSGGHVANATYHDVKTGTSGHAEAIEILFDPTVISFRAILEFFFQIHDPSTPNRQGNDRGTQYRSGIYFTTQEQAEAAKAIIAEIEGEGVFDASVVTEVLPLANYSAAEDYHQDFFERNPTQGYCMAVAAPKVWKFKKTFSEWSKQP